LAEATKETIGSFDLLHLAAVWQPLSIAVRRAAVKSECPYVLAPHGSLDVWPVKYKRLKKLLYYLFAERKTIRLASGISFCSQMELDGSSHFARKGQKLCNIPNGLNFSRWVRDVEKADHWRAEVGIPGDTYLYLSVGRLHYKKGLELAIRALAPMRGENWRLALVGNDEDGTAVKLTRQVKDLGLSDHVSFHPTVSPDILPAIYSAADLFVLPSYHENFGMVVLEAVACGCPVLVSDEVGVSRELSEIKGVAVRKRDVVLWSEALKSAYSRSYEFKTCSGDRNELERRFSIESCALKMKTYYDSVITCQERSH
jgi:glycosyltransferase involved in cell wall biosynthesis